MSRPRAADAEVTVVSRIAATDTVTMLELASLDGAALPAWEPGAHIDVLMPSGLVRQYSLCGDPTAATWRIAVLREETSRGGSEWICSSVEEGAALRLAGPRNHFSFAPTTGAPVLFFAAGMYGMGLTIQHAGFTPAPALIVGILSGAAVIFDDQLSLHNYTAEVDLLIRLDSLTIQ